MSRSIFYDRGSKGSIGRKLSLIAHSLYLGREPLYEECLDLWRAAKRNAPWLADALNDLNDYRYLYEPFNREHVPLCRHLSERQYVRPHDDPQFLEPARAIFEGRIWNAWVNQHHRRAIVQRWGGVPWMVLTKICL